MQRTLRSKVVNGDKYFVAQSTLSRKVGEAGEKIAAKLAGFTLEQT